MDDAELLMRIRVVVGSTRAAAKSLRADDVQLAGVFDRGQRLLDAMTADVERNGNVAVRERFARAREELAEIAEASAAHEA
jgi:hypothetical protein